MSNMNPNYVGVQADKREPGQSRGSYRHILGVNEWCVMRVLQFSGNNAVCLWDLAL